MSIAREAHRGCAGKVTVPKRMLMAGHWAGSAEKIRPVVAEMRRAIVSTRLLLDQAVSAETAFYLCKGEEKNETDDF